MDYREADVDASAALFDEELAIVDTVWYKKQISNCGSVVHSKDNLTGFDYGETISVNLSAIPGVVSCLLFAVCIRSSGLTFRNFESLCVRLLSRKEDGSDCEFFRSPLAEMSGHAILMGVLVRNGAFWSFNTLRKPATGHDLPELLQCEVNLRCLSQICCPRQELRRITVTVIKGRELAPKDAGGFFRSASSDPYFIIQFGENTFKSEHKSKTLEPEWKLSPFEMGLIAEVETQRLEVKVFDYDFLSADDFMGAVAIPAYALYALGPGHHTFWFLLGDGPTKSKEDISGHILMHIYIEQCHK